MAGARDYPNHPFRDREIEPAKFRIEKLVREMLREELRAPYEDEGFTSRPGQSGGGIPAGESGGDPTSGVSSLKKTGETDFLVGDIELQSLNPDVLTQDGANNRFSFDFDPLLPRDGSRAMTGELDMGTHKIKAVVDPTLDQDAATKKYVDEHVGAADDHLVKATATDPTPSDLLGSTLNEDGTIAVSFYENPGTLDQFLTLNLAPAFKAIPFVTGAASAMLSAELVLGTAVIMRGDLDDRPAAGTAGRIYIASDLGLVYRDNGASWDEVAHLFSPANYAQLYQDFYEGIPSNGSWILMNGGQITPSVNGLVGLMPPAEINGLGYLYLANTCYDPADNPLARFSVQASQTTYAVMRAGMADDWTGTQPTHGIYVQRIDGVSGASWYGVCRSGGNETTADLGVSADTAIHHFAFKKTGSSVQFYHGDVEAGSAITTNIPSNMLFVGAHIVSMEMAAKALTLDYFLTRCNR